MVLALGFGLVLPTFITLLYFVWLASAPAWLQQTAYVAGKLTQFAFPLVFAVLVERWRPPSFSWISNRRWLQAGVAIGLLQFVLIVGCYLLVLRGLSEMQVLRDSAQQKVTGMGVTGPAGFMALSLFYCVFHSLLEEYYWRWFIYGRLRRICSEIPANLISSLGFAAHHVVVLAAYLGAGSPLVWLGSLAVAVAGMIWAWCFERGSLRGPWIAHLLADAAIFAIGYHLLFLAR